MDNQKDARSDRRILALCVALAGASLLIPYLLRGELSRFDGWLTGQTNATLLCLFASGLMLGAIRPSQAINLSVNLGCTTALGNASVAFVQCPG